MLETSDLDDDKVRSFCVLEFCNAPFRKTVISSPCCTFLLFLMIIITNWNFVCIYLTRWSPDNHNPNPSYNVYGGIKGLKLATHFNN